MRFKCLTCELIFSEKSHLCDHLYSHIIGKDLISKLCCKGLSEVYELNYFLYNHIKLKKFSCTKQFFCKLCKKGFESKIYLEKHICYRSREEPYICHICSEEFRWKYALYKHYVCHAEKKPSPIKSQSSSCKEILVCPFCKKRFASKTKLSKHIRHCSTEKPYTCHICHKGFWGKPALYKHYLSHDGKKPYTCHICSDGFWERRALYEHYHCHQSEIPKV